jgi:hypothetical protein
LNDVEIISGSICEYCENSLVSFEITLHDAQRTLIIAIYRNSVAVIAYYDTGSQCVDISA